MSASRQAVDEHFDPLRLVLAVAIDRHEHVVMETDGVVERRFERRAIAAVFRVADDKYVVAGRQEFGGAVGRAVVDDQYVGRHAGPLRRARRRRETLRCKRAGQSGSAALVGSWQVPPGV